MNGQSAGNGGPQRPRDSWGRPAGPGYAEPEATYEVPWEQPQQPGPQRPGPQRPGPDVPPSQPAGAPYGRPTSPIPGMTPKEFEKMCRSIDKAFSQFSRVVGEGIDKAADALGTSPEKNMQAYEELSRKKQEKARKRQMKQQQKAAQAQARAQGVPGRPANGWGIPQGAQPHTSPTPWAPPATPLAKRNFRSSAALTASGAIMTAVGGAATFFSGITLAVGIAMGLAGDAAGMVTAGFFGLLTAAFATLLGFGIRNLRTASALKSFQRIFGNREVCTFEELAGRTQTSPKKALATARKLLRRGLVPHGRIDDGATCLMVTDGAYRQYRQLQQAQRQTLAEQQAAEAARAARAADAAARERDLNDRLTPAERAFVTEGRGYLTQLRQLDEAIDDAAVSERIVAIEEVLGRILARAEEEPKVIAGLDRLTAYYLPTTVKLLAAYDDLEEQPVQGENISTSRQEIERTLTVLHGAFEKLLDDTYQDLSLDVSADITVLHAMLAQEGLVEGPFDAKP